MVIFGDGVNGAVPAAGSRIAADYLETLGEAGNLGGTGIALESRHEGRFPGACRRISLHFRYNPSRQIILYATDPAYLDTVLASQPEWKSIFVPPMTLWMLTCDNLSASCSLPWRSTHRFL